MRNTCRLADDQRKIFSGCESAAVCDETGEMVASYTYDGVANLEGLVYSYRLDFPEKACGGVIFLLTVEER